MACVPIIYSKPSPIRPSNYDGKLSTPTGRIRTSFVIPKQTSKHTSPTTPQVETEEATHTHTRNGISTFHRVRPCVRACGFCIRHLVRERSPFALGTLHNYYYWCWSTVCLVVSFLLLSHRFGVLTRNFIGCALFCPSVVELRADCGAHFTNSFGARRRRCWANGERRRISLVCVPRAFARFWVKCET